MKEINVDILVYLIQVKNKDIGKLLNNDEIHDLFKEIKDLPYNRNNPHSKVLRLGDFFYSIDVEDIKENEISFFAGKERDAQLPPKRNSQGGIKPIKLDPQDNLVEVSLGVVYVYDSELKDALILFIQKNWFGCSISKIKQFIETLHDNYEVILSVLTKQTNFIGFIESLSDLRYVEMSEVNVIPKGFGDRQYLAKHEDENTSVRAKKIIIDVRDREKKPYNKIKELLSLFGIHDLDEKSLREFIGIHDLKLTAIKIPDSRQESIDLIKDLMLFSYKTESKRNFDRQEFYKQCQWNFNNNKDNIYQFARKIIQSQ